MASASKGKTWLMLEHGVRCNCFQYMRNAGELADRIAPDLIGHVASTNTWLGNSVDEQVRNLRLLLD